MCKDFDHANTVCVKAFPGLSQTSNFQSMGSSHTASPHKYPYPIEVNVREFVPISLSNRNYFPWKTLMLRLISNQGLVGFINGEVLAPPKRIMVPDEDDDSSTNGMKEIANRDYWDWKRSDALLQRWIIGTINEDVFPHELVRFKTSKDMWSKLINLHERKIEYPYPVAIKVRDYVSIKLSTDNYLRWKRLIRRLIKSQGLLGFINGEVSAPPERITVPNDDDDDDDDDSFISGTKKIENQHYSAWNKTDLLLQTWIKETTDEDVLALLPEHVKTAEDMWKALQTCLNFGEETKEDTISTYLPLHNAALTGDWERAKKFIRQNPEAKRAFVTRTHRTALMISVKSARRNHFVKNLLETMSAEDLAVRNNYGGTALHHAAFAGNIKAAKFLVDKNPNLPHCCDDDELSPLLAAALHSRSKMVRYLWKVTKEEICPIPFEGEAGANLVKALMVDGPYDIALSLIQRNSELAWVQPSPLKIIASRSSAFRSGAVLNWWQNLIYSYVPTKLEETTYYHGGGDIENPADKCFLSVPQVNSIQEMKLKHLQACQFVKHLCSNILKPNYSKAKEIIKSSLMSAASSGIPEVIEEILEVFPELAYCRNEKGQHIFHVAILNRCESVFNLIYQFHEEVRQIILSTVDSNSNRCLELVADLGKEQKLHLRASAAGAALQMQRELQWFKEVEKSSFDHFDYNTDKRSTPRIIFTETHEELVKEGEKWMKDTATSCTIIAALVATIVFAAAITVPGGNDDISGLPIFLQDKAFIVFIISDVLALFSSVSSVLEFLSILTSRYAEIDFLSTLPNRLIIGLVTLFISIISMMIAFGAILQLLFGHKSTWIIFPIIAFSSIPVTIFAYSQFPLLLDMIKSTRSPDIFRQKSGRILS
ncbi:protein ACCELERATED CELL DEATH 6-like isoform X2 [Cornus florida]|uniref:protein ACCELERATED CELL DEATH 6-like isoform X2 n=1 Tax=Cornus florida TaxID=4283 RepID=UPI0028A256E3|nr:protein ACCELERATED CELL DEATH 6-like isoform X2 [Cornus florida]